MVIYVIAYGSLLNRASRSRTTDCYTAFPIWVKGYQRVWGVRSQQTRSTALAVMKSSDESGIGCVAIPVDELNLADLDVRERGYHRVQISFQTLSLLVTGPLSSLDQYYIYEPILITEPSKDFPILLSYVDVIAAGALSISKNFVDSFFSPKLSWKYIENDRHSVRYVNFVQVDDVTTKTVDEYLLGLHATFTN